MQASEEVWGHISGRSIPATSSSRCAGRSRANSARLKANESLECRDCHSAESMDLSKQNPARGGAPNLPDTKEKTCIDCHKGIAHSLPNARRARMAVRPSEGLRNLTQKN